MNFLQIVQRTARESGGISGAGPTTVVSQSGEYLSVVEWVQDVWRQLQIKKDNWLWMRASASVQTVAGTRSYSVTAAAPNGFALTRWRMWWKNTFRIYSTALGVSDESALTWLTYDEFRDYYMMGQQQQQRPQHFCVAPNGDILLGPVPDAIYTVTGDYQKSSQSLALDADVPELPEEFHMMLVYAALVKYARYDAAPEVYEDSKDNYKSDMQALVRTQTPLIEMYNETLVE